MWGSATRRDAVIALGFAAACLVEVVLRDLGRPLWLLVGLASVGGCLLLLLRRCHPLVALGAFCAGAAVSTYVQSRLADPTPRTTGAFVPILALVLLCYSLGAHGGTRAVVLGAPQPVALVALVDLLQPVGGSLLQGLAFFALFVVGAPVLAGRLVRRRRAMVAELHDLEDAALAEHRSRLAAVQAEESLAISQELQRTLVTGLRGLQDVRDPAVVEARARDLLASTRATVVRLNRSAHRPTDASLPSCTTSATMVAATTSDAATSEEGEDRRSGIVVLCAAAVGTTMLVETHDRWPSLIPALGLTALIVTGLVLAIRRPLAVLVVAWAAALSFDAFVTSLADSLSAIALTVAGVFLACWLLPGAAALAAALAMVAAAASLPAGDLPGIVAFAGLAAVSGVLLRGHDRLVAAVRSAHRAAQVRRSTELESRVVGERARIARELHDSVGHGLTVVALQAAAARRLAGTDPAASGAAMVTLRAALDQTLAELDQGFSLAPTVADLVRAARAVGMAIDLVGEPPRGVAGILLDRVVREALTNAWRHAPGAATRLTFTTRADTVHCRVANDHAPAPSYPVGSGLAGVAARVAEAGGTATWGRTESGGFELSVSLPLTREVVR